MRDNFNELVSVDDDVEQDREFSRPVREYQKVVEDIIAWLFKKEEELQERKSQLNLQEAKFSKLLEEYSKHDKFITEFCEFCHTIMQCREDGQELKDNDETLTDEDRDEIGIQLDTMMVCHEKLKILITDRLNELRKILEDRQQTQIEQFEEWLLRVERQLENFTSIGPDSDSVQKQMIEINNIDAMLEKQQDILNFISNVVSVIFDEVNPINLQIRSRSCTDLDSKLDIINHRWKEVCRLVGDRRARLIQANDIWKIFNTEGSLFSNRLKTIRDSLTEMSEMAENLAHTQVDDEKNIEKLKARSFKINEEIARQQSCYTRLEEKLKFEIDKVDNPSDELCTMLIHELSTSLDYMQIDWDKMMKGKRTLDYKLQLLENPQSATFTSMIPVPDSITSTSNHQVEFSYQANNITNSPLAINAIHVKDPIIQSSSNSQSYSSDNKQDLINRSYSAGTEFDNSISSESKSLLFGTSSDNQRELFAANNIDSQDELSTSLTVSNPINSIGLDDKNTYCYSKSKNDASSYLIEELQEGLHLDEIRHDCRGEHKHDDSANCCRVEEWKDSLESFSNWLKQVETSLDIPSTPETIVDREDTRNQSCYFRLDPFRQLLLLNEIENRISSTCQDEFDCLILQGHEIIEDLVPAIGANDYESNSNKLRGILSDIESRYASVKKCLYERKRELADERRWMRLIETLQDACGYTIKQLDEIIPENDIGVDLITLAQQQDELMHLKTELKESTIIESSIQEADMFLKICDFFQQQQSAIHTIQSMGNSSRQPITDPSSIISNGRHDLWTSFKNFKDDIEKHRDSLLIHCSELSHTIEERLKRLDNVHKEMHALQHKMQELATKLQVAEILRSSWIPVEDLPIEKLSEQLEDLKLFRERVSEIETVHQSMNSIFDWMTDLNIPLSQQNLKRLGELNDIWNLIEISIEERQKSIEQAFDNQSSSEQRFLDETLAGLPRWERRVATSKVPYFIDHESNKTHWDHPKFTELLKSMSNIKQYIFSAYRTALKIRLVQKKLGIDLLMLENLKDLFKLEQQQSAKTTDQSTVGGVVLTFNNNDSLIGVEQIIFYLKAIYEKIRSNEKPNLDVPLSIELTLNWLLNLYDSTRTGYISVLSFKAGLTLICCATREEKYTFLYELIANQRTGSVDGRKLGTLFETCMRIPIYLGEGESFGGSEIIETSIKDCFSTSKYNPQDPNCIDLDDYLNWLKSEPQFIIWLPVLHRLLISENVRHKLRCKLCGANPIIGLRFRCLKCFKFNVCQNCFLSGRHLHEHHDPLKHPMREYCNTTSSGENVRDFTKILRNKLKPRS